MRAIGLLLTGMLAGGCKPGTSPDAGPQTTFAASADQAMSTMEDLYYDTQGMWHACVPDQCYTTDFDWGADSLTDALFLHWKTTGDATAVSMLESLNQSGFNWQPCNLPDCVNWSDVPQWDSIAASREFEATGDAIALTRAKAAFAMVDTSNAFALGACPSINYQQPGGGIQLKTLETDSNYIKAAILLYDHTQDASYLSKATAKYQAVRMYFLDPTVPLYTAYVFDDGTQCTQVPRRFFASVNGNMIWAGVNLSQATGDSTYLAQAIATANAVVTDLSDASGVFVDLQAECDVVEPLIEGMYELASEQSAPFAKTWLLQNAQVSASARTSHGVFGRFFNGPPPPATVTEWQSNGGFALSFVAAALEPDTVMVPDDVWANSSFVTNDLSTLPSSLSFSGRAIALIGTIGEECCEPGHARVFIDGTETFDQTGIWQNETETEMSIPNTILFSWRWPDSGTHTLQFQPGVANAKEGGPFLHVQGYQLAK
jgi:hypothetical protein